MYKKYLMSIIIFILIIIELSFIPTKTMLAESSEDCLIFEHITTENGLSQNFINCIAQDNYGYMWFGTLIGLNKYDGIEFNIYKNGPTVSGSVLPSIVLSIYKTQDNKLWIGTTEGLSIFDPSTKTFSANYIHDPDNPKSISNNRINAIYEDSYGTLWIGTAEGLNSYNLETNTFINYPNSTNWITSIFGDSSKNLWIGTTEGLSIFDPSTKTFSANYIHDPDNPKSISNNRINAIYEDSHGTLWIGTAEGLNSYNLETNTFTTYLHDPYNSQSISDNCVTSFCEDNNEYLWVGTRGGLNKLNIKDGIFHVYKNEVDNKDSISNSRIVSLYIDDSGILWVGTSNGLNKVNFDKQAFKYYTGILGNNNVLQISSIDNRTLWLEIWGGAIEFDIYTHDIKAIFPDIFTDQTFFVSMRNTFCMGIDKALWEGTGSSGLLRFDPETNQIKIFKHESDNENSLLNDNIISVYFSHDGTLWIGTAEGLCSFNLSKEEFTKYNDNPEFPDSISAGPVRTIYEDAANNLLFGVDSGVYILYRETGKIACVMDDSVFTQETSDKAVYAIYGDTNGQYWIGTGCGLYRYNPMEGKITPYGIKNVLLYNTILNILEDDNGDLWIATRQGIGKLSIEEDIYTEYGLKDGLQDNFFTVGASYKAEDGQLIFGCSGGLISFYPDDIIEDTNPPKIVVNDFKLIDNTISFKQPIEDIKEINLSYFDNSFEIDFVALHYKSPDYNQYAYKLEGFDEDWHYCNANESFTKYTNIPSGEYTFRVIASNSDQVWNEEGISLNINIAVPFWKHWLFISLSTSIVLFILVMYIRFKTRGLQLRAKELEFQIDRRTNLLTEKAEQMENISIKLEETNNILKKQIQQRIEFTRALVHELKTPLTATINSSEALLKQTQDKISHKLANNIFKSANKLDRRINEILDLAKTEIGTLEVKCQPLEVLKLVKEIFNNMLLEAEKKRQILKLEAPKTLPKIVADRERLEQVLLNLLNNAFKYNKINGLVTLKITEDGSSVIIEVKDEGIGIKQDDQLKLFKPYQRFSVNDENVHGLGLGLALSKQLIELQNGNIWVKSEIGKGSSFYISFPINNS